MSKKVKKNTQSLSGYMLWRGGKNFEFQSLDGRTLKVHPESVTVSSFMRKQVYIQGFLKKDGQNKTVEGEIVVTAISLNMFFH
jgi:hypothetical protein